MREFEEIVITPLEARIGGCVRSLQLLSLLAQKIKQSEQIEKVANKIINKLETLLREDNSDKVDKETLQ